MPRATRRNRNRAHDSEVERLRAQRIAMLFSSARAVLKVEGGREELLDAMATYIQQAAREVVSLTAELQAAEAMQLRAAASAGAGGACGPEACRAGAEAATAAGAAMPPVEWSSA